MLLAAAIGFYFGGTAASTIIYATGGLMENEDLLFATIAIVLWPLMSIALILENFLESAEE